MTDAPQKMRAPRWMRVVLVLSLALNLLIVGVVVGAVSSGKSGPPRFSDVGFGPYTAALSREDQRALRRAVREQTGRINWSEARSNFQALLTVLRTEPFDATEMTRLMDAQGGMVRDRQEVGKQALIDRISSMSSAERAAFADRVEETLRRGRKPQS